MVAAMVAGAVAGALLATGSAGAGAADVYATQVSGVFAPPSALVASSAKTYDLEKVPAGARITVGETSTPAGTRVTLGVSGLQAGYAYGAHVHQKPCGALPEAAGGHYQNRVDPVQPSTDPAYVNPRNEVWLDFTTDAQGRGHAEAQHDWGFRKGGARSVVLHREQGGAGDRLACFSVPFGPRQG
ncbi:Copper/zinc superoxide dismutase (SODC) [Streptomyces sp. YIM 130001]|uniref:superoxide dismutase family protein n=1 Tax=Streptomyces sp. YIM 130001 TaxID=2259644 RepID=UPI000E65C2A5|nr:superoxide dismutase family protein [Streptomyces sp. YIM 130001]RII16962.1 Copper/zinc superoxide dismutase (SODC) [Streptomyces sp. YIM 130001]